MNPLLVFVVYGAAFLLALALLYRYCVGWYWHALSIVIAFVIGLTPFPEGWRPPDLVVGFFFVFLFVWGFGAPFFRGRHRRSLTQRNA
ncbi:MAG TPA: hypothetical protein PLA43_16345 [Bryobacteraceae bacterium]|nr:hypothetical protein [Bryobacteraceae bacterium]HOQ47549.1 hypothetical protein [Bryobacteraceae bacterium]HPQ15651.1 hypothetical protein [Bryobacteraceae bacterium]HPU73523.1 hypothetical protein [Bryobacteraceae bacterium]